MNVETIFARIKNDFNSMLHFLEDKPEENVDSTFKACLFAASGSPRSAAEAIKYPLPTLSESQIKNLDELIGQRLKNVPLAHITGRQNFMGIELLSDKRALIPRKETELLGRKAIDISLDLTKSKQLINVMDICCGAGNLGLAVAFYNPDVKVFATDLSHEAVELTKDNISFLNLNQRVHAKQGDLFSAFETSEFFENSDLVICNPPYISSAKVTKLNSEIIGHEPSLAFDGGIFGTKIILRLINETHKYLTKNGWMLFEVGVGQGEFIMRLIKESDNYTEINSVSDIQGNIRVIIAQKR